MPSKPPWVLVLLAALAGCPDRPSPRAPAPTALQWVSLPGGSFTMGRDGGDPDEAPVHRVRVPGFRITRTEVTLAQYQRCVDAGRCVPPGTGDRCNWGRPERKDHPVNCVDWAQARRFCRWAGGRLPTEAEWEYAARSGGQPWTYPWGQEPASCARTVMPDRAGLGCGKGGTWPVCSRPRGNSRQGLCDLAGNVWEWVADCWHGSYRDAPQDGSAWTTRCKGKDRMVVRGSSFLNGTPDDLRAASRDSSPAGRRYFSIGLRCARDAT
jgi:formylglycine-generating enzyme required for sulfatase activity